MLESPAQSKPENLAQVQSVPEQTEHVCDNEANNRHDGNQDDCNSEAEWADHINRLDEVHPENEIDQWLGST
jgi:hypothetical protein